jgi:short-subunit dehydrogenase
VQADLATLGGIDALCDKIKGRRVDALLANAGRGLRKAFLDQEFDDVAMCLIRILRRSASATLLISGSFAAISR